MTDDESLISPAAPALMTVTVCVQEISTPYPPPSPWPLLYVLQIADIKNTEGILGLVAAIRVDELGIDEDELPTVQAGLELLFAFAGDVDTIADWRE